MKINVKRPFRYMDGTETKELQAGIQDLSNDLAAKVLKWGRAEVVVAKKKVAKKAKGRAPENKARVGK